MAHRQARGPEVAEGTWQPLRQQCAYATPREARSVFARLTAFM
ncbi:hypothetical protein ACIREO_23870 [Streptomyces sp. NPDC102441]